MGALLADANSNWLSSHVIWNIMWVGLAVLTISLLVLMQTRWGQAKPLSKCVVLSIFAHVLLIAYAHMTQLFAPGPARTPAPISFKLSNVAFEEQSDRQTQQQQAKPWDVTNVAQLPSPKAAPLARPEDQSPIAADAPPEWPLEDAPLSEAIAPPVEMDEPTELVENHTAPVEPSIAPRGSMIAAAEIAAVAAAPVAAEAAAEVADALGNTPMAPTLARRDSTGPPVPEATEPQIEPSQDDRHMNDQIHQLAEMAATAAPADAIQSEIDQLRAADNRIDGPTTTSPESANGTPAQLASARAAGDQKKLAQLDTLGVPAPATSRRTLAASPLPLAMQARVADNQADIIQAQGGDPRIEASVDAALVWMAANQEDDGRWDASRHSAGNEQQVLGHDRYGAGADADTGVTGLAVLAFMARGHTHLEGKHRTNVQHGLEFLISQQHETGSLAGESRLFAQMYCHGIAMLALSEAYAMTRDDRIRPALEAALNYSFQSQHQTSGGWRYQPGDLGDTSQFGWQVLALHSAQLAGIETPERTRDLMTRFLRSVSSGDHNGLASYRPGERTSSVMTAEALVCRVFLDAENGQQTVEEAANYVSRFEPAPGKPNLYFWYYGTIGLHQLQGDRWRSWSASLQRQLLTSQENGGMNAGSWSPDTVWGCYGGRVYTTAMATLSLEVYFRYLPIYYDLQNRPAPVAQAPLQFPASGVRISSKPENLAPR